MSLFVIGKCPFTGFLLELGNLENTSILFNFVIGKGPFTGPIKKEEKGLPCDCNVLSIKMYPLYSE